MGVFLGVLPTASNTVSFADHIVGEIFQLAPPPKRLRGDARKLRKDPALSSSPDREAGIRLNTDISALTASTKIEVLAH